MSNKLIYAGILAGLVMFWTGILSLVWTFSAEPKRVDCSMSEFHPDFTNKMREQCRAARKEVLK